MIRELLNSLFGERIDRRRFLTGTASVALLPAAGEEASTVFDKRHFAYLVNTAHGDCIINTPLDKEIISIPRGGYVAFDGKAYSAAMHNCIGRFAKANLIAVIGVEKEAEALAHRFRRTETIIDAEWTSIY